MCSAVVQRIKIEGEDDYKVAERYFSVMSSLNSLNLTERETQIVAFASIHGNMSHTHIKNDCCKKYGTSIQTINNVISRMKKIGVFIKEKEKIKVHPSLALNFGADVILQVVLTHKKNG